MRVHASENWYRDVWLVVITVVVLLGVKANSARVTEARKSRFNATVAACAESNDRNTKTIAILERNIDRLPPAERRRSERAVGPVVLLINALDPYRPDCTAYARERTSQSGGKARPAPPALTPTERVRVEQVRASAEAQQAKSDHGGR